MPKRSNVIEDKPSEEFASKSLTGERESWIQLEFKLINWKYMNFSLKVKESTNIFTIKNILRERHGQMEDLKICFTAFTEGNEVKNDMLTLTDCGLKGEMIRTTLDPSTGELISDESDVPTVQLLYDYKPSASDMDPLLLY